MTFALIVAMHEINGDAESDDCAREAAVVELHAGVDAEQNVGDTDEDRGDKDDEKRAIHLRSGTVCGGSDIRFPHSDAGNSRDILHAAHFFHRAIVKILGDVFGGRIDVVEGRLII